MCIRDREIPIPAEKLLQQELVSVRKAENGQWYAITTDPQPKMSESEQMLSLIHICTRSSAFLPAGFVKPDVSSSVLPLP